MNWIYNQSKQCYIFKEGGSASLTLDPNAASYILLLENRLEKQHKNNKWYKYDEHTGGAGIDIRYNPEAKKLFDTLGYLTDDLEMKLRLKNLNYGLGVILRKYNYITDPELQLITLGLIYRGDSKHIKALYNKDTNIYRRNVSNYYDSIGHYDRALLIRNYKYPKSDKPQINLKPQENKVPSQLLESSNRHDIAKYITMFGQSPWGSK